MKKTKPQPLTFDDVNSAMDALRAKRDAQRLLEDAAPDLYEALARLMDHLPPNDVDDFGLYEAAKDRARAALAKATVHCASANRRHAAAAIAKATKEI